MGILGGRTRIGWGKADRDLRRSGEGVDWCDELTSARFCCGQPIGAAVRDKRPMRVAATVAAIFAIVLARYAPTTSFLPVKGRQFAVAKVEILPAPPKLALCRHGKRGPNPSRRRRLGAVETI